MFSKIFLAGMIFSISGVSVMAQNQNNVDYDKPFDQIKEQSMFDRSHSLMPVPEVVNTTANVVVPPSVEPVVLNSTNQVQVLDGVQNNVSENTETVSKSGIQNMKTPVITQEKVEIKSMNAPVQTMTAPVQQMPAVSSPEPIWQNNSFQMGQATTDMMQSAQVPVQQNQDLMVQQPMGQNQIQQPAQQNQMIQQPVMQGQVQQPMVYQQNSYPVVNDMSTSYQVGATPYDRMKMENPIVLKRPVKTNEIQTQPVINTKQDVIEEVVYEAPARNNVNAVDTRAKAHIASYVNSVSANEGIAVYKSKYPRMDMFEASVKYENVPNKGWFHRVYLLGDEKELEMLCREMKSHNDWCKVYK